MNVNELSDLIADMPPEEWRLLLLAAAEHRCIACGEWDRCECPDRVDEAKVLVVQRAAQ